MLVILDSSPFQMLFIREKYLLLDLSKYKKNVLMGGFEKAEKVVLQFSAFL